MVKQLVASSDWMETFLGINQLIYLLFLPHLRGFYFFLYGTEGYSICLEIWRLSTLSSSDFFSLFFFIICNYNTNIYIYIWPKSLPEWFSTSCHPLQGSQLFTIWPNGSSTNLLLSLRNACEICGCVQKYQYMKKLLLLLLYAYSKILYV